MALVRFCFCGRSQNEVPRLVASTTSATAICGPCTLHVVEVLIAGRDEPPEVPVVLTPAGRATVARSEGTSRWDGGAIVRLRGRKSSATRP